MYSDSVAVAPAPAQQTNLNDLPPEQQVHVLVGLLNQKQYELTLVTEQLQAIQSAYFATKAELHGALGQVQALLPALKETSDLRAKLDALQVQIDEALPKAADDPKRKGA